MKTVKSKVPRLPRETKQRDAGNLQKWPLLQNLPYARPYGPHTNRCGRLRTVANDCGRKRNVPANIPSTKTGTLATYSGITLIMYVYPLQIYVNIFFKYVQMLDPAHLNIYRILPGFCFSPLPRSSAMVPRASPPLLKICRAVLYSDQEMWHLADVGMQFWSVFLMRMN